MVVKLSQCTVTTTIQFENGVVLYGSQTKIIKQCNFTVFENGVVLYGSQTYSFTPPLQIMFENGVVLYGSQTHYKKDS